MEFYMAESKVTTISSKQEKTQSEPLVDRDQEILEALSEAFQDFKEKREQDLQLKKDDPEAYQKLVQESLVQLSKRASPWPNEERKGLVVTRMPLPPSSQDT
jgi:broad specificity phosphatase PhoE